MRKLRTSELNRLTPDQFKRAEKLPIIVVLDDVRSHHNVGSIFRTCDAFRVSRIILGGITPKPPHVEIEKTALGATESVDWEYVADLAQFLSSHGKSNVLIGMEHTTQSKSLSHFSLQAYPITLIFGNEVKGISTKVLDYCNHVLEIPQLGTKHSLNVSVSAGIAIWQFAQRFLK